MYFTRPPPTPSMNCAFYVPLPVFSICTSMTRKHITLLAGCRLAAVAPRWPPGRAGGRAGALLLSLHPCTCMLLRISCDFFLSFPFFFFSFIFPSCLPFLLLAPLPSFSFLPSPFLLCSTTSVCASLARPCGHCEEAVFSRSNIRRV